MVGNCFLVHYLKIFHAKAGLPFETDGKKIVVVQKLYRWLARTRANK